MNNFDDICRLFDKKASIVNGYHTINEFHQVLKYVTAGGRFDHLTDKERLKLVPAVIKNGTIAMSLYAAAGGSFAEPTSGLADPDYPSFGHVVAFSAASPEAIAIFAAAGGSFDDSQDRLGRNAARYIVEKGSAFIKAYMEAGGKFSDTKDLGGNTAGIRVAVQGKAAIEAYIQGGGKFDDSQNLKGVTAGMRIAHSGAEAMKLFVEAGGIFDDKKDRHGYTARDWVEKFGDKNEFERRQKGRFSWERGSDLEVFDRLKAEQETYRQAQPKPARPNDKGTTNSPLAQKL